MGTLMSSPAPAEGTCGGEDVSVIAVSDAVVGRLMNSPEALSQRMWAVDQAWYDKMACIDERHSKKYVICDEEFDRLISEMEKSYEMFQGNTLPCYENVKQVLGCYQRNQGQSLNCATEVAEFSACIECSRKRAADMSRIRHKVDCDREEQKELKVGVCSK